MKSIIRKHSKCRYIACLMALLTLLSASMSVSAASGLSAASDKSAALGMPAATGVSAASDKVTAKVEVKQKLKGTDCRKAEFYYELKPADKASPAPIQQKIAIKGSAQASFEIVFDEVGIYRYTLHQISEKKDNWSIDIRSYSVEVYVVRAEETDVLSAIVLCYDQDGKKTDAVFENTCQPPKTDTDSPKTGDDGVLFWGWSLLLGIVLAKISRKKTRLFFCHCI